MAHDYVYPFERSCKFVKNNVQFHTLNRSVWGCPFFQMFANTRYGQCYDWNHSNGRILVYHCGFIVHSSDDWWGEHLFVCVSFCELSSDMFCPFLNCLLFLLYFQGSLHILETSLLFAFLCYKYILAVCGSYFSFCSNVFQRTKVLTFIIPHLPIFYSLCFHFVILRIPLVSFVLSVFV